MPHSSIISSSMFFYRRYKKRGPTIQFYILAALNSFNPFRYILDILASLDNLISTIFDELFVKSRLSASFCCSGDGIFL